MVLAVTYPWASASSYLSSQSVADSRCNPHATRVKKERKKTDNPREGWEDGTPPPHRDFLRRGEMGWSHSPPQTPIFLDFSWRGTSSLLWEQLTQSRRGSPQHLGLTRPD